jgi:SAM-dependent methyltransferase
VEVKEPALEILHAEASVAAGPRAEEVAAQQRSARPRPREAGDETVGEDQVELRRFPYPYRAMLALSSDIDQTTPARFREVHRFLNTHEETSMGPGVGLDVADTFWLFHPRSTSRDPANRVMSYFGGLEVGAAPSDDAEEIAHYVRSGWIDSLHTYGNFSGVAGSASRCTRRHAEAAIEALRAADLRIRVWINHGDRNNVQNLGTYDYMEGDRPGTPAYHWDLLRDYGVEFVWSSTGSFTFAESSKIVPVARQDGSPSWEFTRFSNAHFEDALRWGLSPAVAAQLRRTRDYAVLWHPPHLHVQLSDENLDAIVEREQIAIVAQHLGATRPLLRLGGPTVAALRRLDERQERGEILVARTERALVYNRNRELVRYSVTRDGDRTAIDIVGVDDPVRGRFVPSLEDLAGLTFRVRDPGRVDLLLASQPLDEALIQRNPSDGVAPSIGLKWHEPDLTDHSSAFREKHRVSSSRPEENIERLQRQSMEFLDAQQPQPQGQGDAKKFNYALQYTKNRYAIGLAKYVSILDSLGFGRKRRALDIGSGAGHWCVAFSQVGEQVDGIDSSPEFVELATRLARELQLDDRVRFQVGTAERLPFEDGTFDAVWSHGVLMFAETELAMREAARVLAEGGLFYCGYSSFGFRLNVLYRSLVQGSESAVRAQVANLLGDRLYRAGLHGNEWSRTRALTFDELVAMADVFGMRFVDAPGVADSHGLAFGHETTVDLLVRKEADALEHPGRLEKADWQEVAPELERLVELGCGRLVLEVLDAREWQAERHPGSDALRLRAMVKAGLASSRGARDLAQEVDDPYLLGLFWHDRRDYAAALDAYARVPDEAGEHLALLRGCAMLSLERDDEAQAVLTAAAKAGRDELACRIALLEPALRRGELAEVKARYAEVLRLAAVGGGADNRSAELIAALA